MGATTCRARRSRRTSAAYTAASKLGLVTGGSGRVEVVQLLPGDANWIAAVEAGERARSAATARRGPSASVAPAAVTPDAAASDVPRPEAARPAAATPTTPVAGAEPRPASAAPARAAWLQLGAFADRANAEDFARKMLAELDGLAAAAGCVVVPGGSAAAPWRVQAGPFVDRATARLEADRVVARLGGGRPFVVER
ncbi:MAG: SPOR domain-containing protein [Burkholderiales bacterium]|nr:SPOR domain-containing protein [Burkholderiales bacterium]